MSTHPHTLMIRPSGFLSMSYQDITIFPSHGLKKRLPASGPRDFPRKRRWSQLFPLPLPPSSWIVCFEASPCLLLTGTRAHTLTHTLELNFVTCSVLVVAISDTEVLSSNQVWAFSPMGHPYGQVESMQGNAQSRSHILAAGLQSDE